LLKVLSLFKVALILINVLTFLFIVYVKKRKYSFETIQLLFSQQPQESKTDVDLINDDQSNNDKNEEKQKEKGGQVFNDHTRKTIGIVIAHPDDEAMFMTPTILSLKEYVTEMSAKNKKSNTAEEEKSNDEDALDSVDFDVCLLCLSTGNADGIGSVRVKELEQSCRVLGITNGAAVVFSDCKQIVKESKLLIVDHEKLQDGMNQCWGRGVISDMVTQFIRVNNISTLLTFDQFGISNHPNHIATHEGVRRACTQLQNQVILYELVTSSLLRKYIGVLDFCLSVARDKSQEDTVILFTPSMSSAFKSMTAHYSQFVWFRKLFILFSRYAYVNTWERCRDP